MADKTDIRRTADSRFAAAESRDRQIKLDQAKQSAAFDARTIKLRAMRLEAEEQARLEKEKRPVAAPKAAVKAPRASRKKAAH